MRTNARNDAGFLTVELMVAVMLIVVALLALMAAYDQAFYSLRSSAKTTAAGQLGENQLELYASLPYASIGLDATALSTAQSSDSTYEADETALPGSGTDATISGCGSSPQCSPVQTVTGSDHKSYTVETFIRLLTNPSTTSWTEKVVVVIVRDPNASGSPKVFTDETAFDQGPPTS